MKTKRSASQPPVKDNLNNEIFCEEFLSNLLNYFGNDVKLASSSSSLFNSIALDFVKTLTQQAVDLAKSRNSDTLEEKDFIYALKMFYDIEIPSSDPSLLRSSSGQSSAPTTQYQAKINAARAAISSIS